MIKKGLPIYRQLDQMDCGPTCLQVIAKYYGKYYSLDVLRKKSNITKEGVSFGSMAEAAEDLGFHSFAVCLDYETLSKEAPYPCIAHWRQKHFVVIYKIKKYSLYCRPGPWISQIFKE